LGGSQEYDLLEAQTADLYVIVCPQFAADFRMLICTHCW
jgi:hypothetical protein